MVIQININENYLNLIKNKNLDEYINSLIEKDLFFLNEKRKFNQRLKSIENGNTISHKEIWKSIDEL